MDRSEQKRPSERKNEGELRLSRSSSSVFFAVLNYPESGTDSLRRRQAKSPVKGLNFYGNKMFKLYVSLNKFKLLKLRRLYHTLGEIFTSNQEEILTALKPLFSFLCNCNCKNFKLWEPYAHLLPQCSRT